MKRFFKIILCICMMFIFGIKGVKAETVNITQQFVDNVWSFHYRNGKVHTYGQFNIKHIDGKIGYCIQPDRAIEGVFYSGTTNWSQSSYNDDIKKQMELYAYYGYEND